MDTAFISECCDHQAVGVRSQYLGLLTLHNLPSSVQPPIHPLAMSKWTKSNDKGLMIDNRLEERNQMTNLQGRRQTLGSGLHQKSLRLLVGNQTSICLVDNYQNLSVNESSLRLIDHLLRAIVS